MNSKLIVAVAVLSLSISVLAYEQPTHRRMSEAAYDISILKSDPSLIQRLGFSESSFEEITSLNEAENLISARVWVSDGAYHEDEGARSLSHFYNPISNSALSVAIPFGGEPSPDWVLTSPSNDNNYGHAVDLYLDFLKTPPSALNNDRKAALNNVFFTLGHVIHHIEDMAQPEHVRNDQHLIIPGLEIGPISFPDLRVDPSYYEEYSLTESLRDESEFNELMNAANQPVHLLKARDYWDSESLDGLAEFTNSNFVSNDTNFILDGSMMRVDTRFPLPTPDQITSKPLSSLLSKNGEGLALCAKLIADFPQFNGSDPSSFCTLDFINTIVIGKYPVESTINDQASTVSFFNRRLEKAGKRVRVCTTQGGDRTCLPPEAELVTTLNRFNFEAGYPFLIPRAVNYSAGMLNHFFRGKLLITDIALDGGGSNRKPIVTVQNVSQLGDLMFSMENMAFQSICSNPQGRFIIYDLEPIEGSAQTIPYGGSLRFRHPTLTCDDMVIFARGNIGEDEGIAVGRYQYTESNLEIATLSFSESVRSSVNGFTGEVYSNQRVSGRIYPGDPLRSEEIFYDDTVILDSGTATYGQFYPIPYDSGTLRDVTYTHYPARLEGCSGACPYFFLDGMATTRVGRVGYYDEESLTRTPIDFLSYIQNWSPSADTEYGEAGEPIGSGWSVISDLTSQENIFYK